MYKKISVVEMYSIMQLALAKYLSVSGASCHPAFMDNCNTISHTCYPYLPSGWVHPFVSGVTKRNEDAG